MPNPATFTPATREAPVEDPFRYGWRDVIREHDGEKYVERIPLTLEDLLHPQEGDTIPERKEHSEQRDYLRGNLKRRLPNGGTSEVLEDHLIDWGVEGIENLAPDVVAFCDLEAPFDGKVGVFPFKELGGRCLFAIELVSPGNRDNDVTHKFREYYQVGVPLYIIVDQETPGGPRTIHAYQHTPEGYVEEELDAQGRVTLDSVRVYLGLKNNMVRCWDLDTGEELGDLSEVCDERDAAKDERDAAIDERDAAKEREAQAKKARAKAERKAKTATKARAKAERKAKIQADARLKAAQNAKKAAQAAKAATEALREAEKRNKELEAELRRLRGS